MPHKLPHPVKFPIKTLYNLISSPTHITYLLYLITLHCLILTVLLERLQIITSSLKQKIKYFGTKQLKRIN